MSSKQRLELTWIGKENRPRLEPRILLENPEKSYHAKKRVAENDIFDNRLIFGDNLLALKALEQDFIGRVKCIYIDPPYNTGSAFEHFDDGVEHSVWLSLIRDRIELLWRLLEPNGTLWISIDDYEMPYIRVVLDEICGRNAFIATNVWQKRYSRENRGAIGDVHEYILFTQNPHHIQSHERAFAADRRTGEGLQKPQQISARPLENYTHHGSSRTCNTQSVYTIVGPTGKSFDPPPGNCWRYSEQAFQKLRDEGRIYFGKDGSSQPTTIRYLSEVEGAVPWTWWPHEEVGNTDEAKKETLTLIPGGSVFDTPKPERLIQRILHIATDEGDLVLDSFAGSGTTGAVAQKMGRRWIMVELGEHAHTHIIPRLKKVIDGEDPGGITEALGWKGGGGFRYFHIAPSLLEKDRFGNLIISKQYNAAMLTEAMCKIMGFTYAPSDELYWQQGHSTENDFLYVTTQTLTREQLAKLSDEVGENRSLLICCAAFRGKADALPNLTVKKIPSAVLAKCEWGHDDYSLNVANLPKAASTCRSHSSGLRAPAHAQAGSPSSRAVEPICE